MVLDLSVIIPTKNRCHILQRTLEHLARQSLVAEAFETIVVDNGSEDETPTMLASWQVEGKNRRIITCETPGLSPARNASLLAARSDIVAFLDDDSIPCREWCQRIVSTFFQVGPQAGCVGGPLIPHWENPRPSWLSDCLLNFYSILDLGSEARWLEPHEIVYGANMAYRRHLLQDIGGFPLQMGRRGNSLLSGEERVVQMRIRTAGYGVYYDPSLIAEHFIHRSRLHRRWLLHRAYYQGINDQQLTVIFGKKQIYNDFIRRNASWKRLCSAIRPMVFASLLCRLWGYWTSRVQQHFYPLS